MESNDVVRSPFWPEASAHKDFWERHNCAHVYKYDSTDDGPETIAPRLILASHTAKELADERELFVLVSESLDFVARDLTENDFVRDAMRLRGVRL